MSIPDILEKQEENTQHIKDVRVAFEILKENQNIAFERFKGNVSFILTILGAIIAAGTILWGISNFVHRTDNSSVSLNKKFDDLQTHMDGQLKALSDTVNSIKHTQAVNQAINDNNFRGVNRHLDQHDYSLKSLNEKYDRFTSKPVYGHKDCPTCQTTFVQSQ